MVMLRTSFPNFTVELPPGWRDITSDKEVPNLPATVARTDGVGALQFSIALHKSGPCPRGSVEELQALLDGTAQSHGLESPSDTTCESSPRGLVASSFHWDDDFVRVWYMSENGSFALVTYTCEHSIFDAHELRDAEKIVRSIGFGQAAAE